MAKELEKVDIVTVGAGWTGGIVASEAAKAGLKVVSLERGKDRGTQDYQHIHDELKYGERYELMQNVAKETITFRNNRSEKALPMRILGSFLPGTGVGGAGTHWTGQVYRFLPYDFEIKTETEKKYGKEALREDEGYRYQDWGITYDELEPYFYDFEVTTGLSGEPSPFGGKRKHPYPTKPMIKTKVLKKFDEAAKNLGYKPFSMPAATLSEDYENPDGITIKQCQYCAFCNKYGCEYGAKASPEVTVLKTALDTGNYEIRTNANVIEVITDDDDDKKVRGVKYIDVITKEEYIQPADVVVLTSFVFNNYKLLRISDIGEQYNPETEEGTLGRNYCYQIQPAAQGFFDEQFNMFMGAGGLGSSLDEFNGDNFDHSNLNFLHGGVLKCMQTGRLPIGSNPTREGTPSWGKEFKEESIRNFTRMLEVKSEGSTSPHKDNYLDIDEDYLDAFGQPQVKLTYNFTDMDRERFSFLTKKASELLKEMGAKDINRDEDIEDYDIAPYQSTHNTGGTVMGEDEKTSVVNNWLQHWDRDNLFVVGAGNFAHNSGYNPTGTVGALAYRCAEGVIEYHKKPRRLEK